MAESKEARDQEMNLKEESKEEKRRNDWWKIDPQGPLESDQWCRVLRQSLPEEKIPSQTCITRRHLGPGPTQHTPSRRDRWIRGQILQAEVLQERLEWRIRGVQQAAKELGEVNRGIWRELYFREDQRGDFSAWGGYQRAQERLWGEQSSPRVLRPGDSKRRRKHL
uniref:Rev protein n=1 Tax=Equine infectious anemia virus TaxID=11665 RepID=Q9E6F9_9RETR|nr:rev protein [Equine infectious anemia virus]